MEKNIGYNDRLARLILGLCAILAAFFIAVKVNVIAGIIIALLGVWASTRAQ